MIADFFKHQFTRFTKKTEKIVEYYIALLITDEQIGAAIFSLNEKDAILKGKWIESFNGDWKTIVTTADSVIAKAANELDLNLVKKIIFAFSAEEITENKVNKDKIPFLKELTNELELVPCGFVAIPEAINCYLETKDGGPQTALLISIGQNKLTLSLFRGGKLTDQAYIDRSKNIIQDIENGLAGFDKVEIFPSKILLHDGQDLDNIKEEILKYPWQSNPKFLHFPKIEVLSPDLVLDAVMFSGASELYKKRDQISKVEGFKKPDEIPVKSIKQVSPSTLGFYQGDIIPQNQANVIKQTVPHRVMINKKPIDQSVNTISEDEDDYREKSPVKLKKGNRFNTILGGKKKFIIAGLISLIILFIAVFYFLISSLSKAKITIIVDPQNYDLQKEISINPDIGIISADNLEIPGKFLDVTVEGSKTASVTGQKLIGDQARGSVNLYNKTTSSRTFEKGTKISAKNLVFALDNNIEIPQATESSEGLAYGKAKVGVTAVKIGTEGNLPAQTEFSIADFSLSSYSGRSEEAFKGGSAREISVVSSKDQDNLAKTLSTELMDKAKKELSVKLVSGEELLNQSLQGEILNKKFDREIDEEAKDVTLSLSTKYKGMTYSTNDFSLLMEKLLSSNIPAGYEFNLKNSNLSISDAIIKDNTVSFKVSLDAKLFPKFDLDRIKTDIAGLSYDDAINKLKQVKNVVAVKVIITSPVDLFKNKIPKTVNNIEISVDAR